jgi:FecR-like protein
MLLKISGVCLVVLGMLCLLLSSPSVQRTIRISSVYGPVEHRAPIATGFVPLSSSSLLVNVGDRVRTGPEGTLTMELPDGTFMIVHQNSAITIQEPRAPTLSNLLNVPIGKVRFYIQRFGGRSTPHGVGTATALIAVRG